MRRSITFAAVLLASVGCTSLRPSLELEPRGNLQDDVTAAQQAAAVGQYDAADTLFVAIATRYPDQTAAREVPYWRALLRLDPANPDASAEDAMRLLDLYLDSPDAVERREEAVMLRRIAAAMDSLASEAGARQGELTKLESAERGRERERELEREVARLRDALEKSNAELERIRRRLAPQQPPR